MHFMALGTLKPSITKSKPYFCTFQSLTDAVIGFVESNGRFFIMDMWTTGYLQPVLESSQDLSKQEGKIRDESTDNPDPEIPGFDQIFQSRNPGIETSGSRDSETRLKLIF